MAKLVDIIGKCVSGEWGQDDNDGTGIPVLRTTNFTNEGIINFNNVVTRQINKKNLEPKYLRKGDIIIEKSGGSDNQPVGRVVYFEGENNTYLFNNFTGLLRVAHPDVWLPKYVFYSLFSNYQRGGSRPYENKTTGLHNLKTDSYISSLEIKDISYEEQTQIVCQLDKISNLIFLCKQQLLQLDDLIKSRFVELFGEIGTDVKGWGLSSLGKCCIINPKKSNDTRLCSDLEVSFVPMPAVSEKGEIDASEIRPYSDVKSGFTYFAENDVLFAKITPCMENGKGAVAKGLYNGIGFGSTEFHVLRPIDGISNPHWIYAVTAFSQFRIDAESNMTGSAGQRRVPASFLENYKVSLPPIHLQNQFADFVEQTLASQKVVQQSIAELEELKKSLMQKYFG